MIRALFMALLACSVAFGDALLIKRNSRPLDAEADLSALEPWETPISGFFVRTHNETPVVDRAIDQRLQIRAGRAGDETEPPRLAGIEKSGGGNHGGPRN